MKVIDLIADLIKNTVDFDNEVRIEDNKIIEIINDENDKNVLKSLFR